MSRGRGPPQAHLRDDIAHVVRERRRDAPVFHTPHPAYIVAERRVRQRVMVGGADLRWEICARYTPRYERGDMDELHAARADLYSRSHLARAEIIRVPRDAVEHTVTRGDEGAQPREVGADLPIMGEVGWT